LTQFGYTGGLEASAQNGRPVLCASCHSSNALSTAGMTGVGSLTHSLHSSHANVKDPVSGLALDSINNRSSCYQCHPGSTTKCLRGAMGKAVDANGNAVMDCQSCHGNMSAVGIASRTGWLQEPNCQACHHDGVRETSALDASGALRAPADTHFMTNANTPAPGFSLYRFSKGHGNLQCEACHGATHAVYPTSHVNDNLLSMDTQGHAGTISECSACHATVPVTGNGGPHGMHTIGSAWVSAHPKQVKSLGRQTCAYCHGADFRGSFLSEVKTAKSLKVEGKTKTYQVGDRAGCYDCHNGPNGG
jgi:Outer membrane cytochrome MtrC/MtrF-like, domains II/IV